MSKTFSKRTKQRFNQPWLNPHRGPETTFSDQLWKACEKKRGVYESERIADLECEKLSAKTSTPWKSYKCEFCKKFHISESKKRYY